MALEVEPELWGISKIKREGQGGLRRDGALALDDIGNAGTWHSGFLGKPVGCDGQRFEKLGDENLAGSDFRVSRVKFGFDGSFHAQW